MTTEWEAAFSEGCQHWDEGQYWEAHEAWEVVWMDLKAKGSNREADAFQGLILATASVENLRRGKPEGFRRQAAEALWRLRGGPNLCAVTGWPDHDSWAAGFLDFYLDACRRTHLRGLDQVRAPLPTFR